MISRLISEKEKSTRNMTEYNVQRIRFVEYEPQGVKCSATEDCGLRRLAICRENGVIEIWNTRNALWNTSLVIPSKQGRSVDRIVWCDSRLFTAGLEGEVTEWDLERLTERTVVDANGGPIWCIAASTDKKQLAVGCEDGSVRLFNIQGGILESFNILDKQELRVLSLAWSKCGGFIVTGSTDCTIRIYDVKSRHVVTRISTDKLKEKNTLVWSIEITSDMTIITGDSLGQTQFWDADTGTLLQSFKSHEADVLTLCISDDEKMAFSSGIDSRIAEFKYLKDVDESNGEWKLTRKLKSVSHDVRSLSLTHSSNPHLIACGVDPRVTHFNLKKTTRSFRYLPLFPDRSPCSIAKDANILLCQDTNSLHIWKLPSCSSEHSKLPKKLLELKSSRDDHIVSSDVSANGEVVVFCDVRGVTAFHVSHANAINESPPVSLSKIKIPQNNLKEIQRVKLTDDGSKMVFASPKGIGILDLNSETKETKFIPRSNKEAGPWQLLEVDESGCYIAGVDASNNILIYHLHENRLISTVPKSFCIPLAVKFQPGTNNVVYVCSGKEFHCFDFIAEKLDPWCSELNTKAILKDFPVKHSKFVNIAFDQKDNSVAFLQAEAGFVKVKIGGNIKNIQKIGKKRKLPDEEKVSKDIVGDCVSSTRKYECILHLGITSENSLVIVERPLKDILNSLPPALKLKKFGT